MARALVNEAAVLLIDEPGENLDRADAEAIQSELLDSDSGLIEPGRAVVMVTHRLPAVHRADAVIDLGSISLPEKAVAELVNRE
jgi:ATP-binding cassette subfamily C protein CydC